MAPVLDLSVVKSMPTSPSVPSWTGKSNSCPSRVSFAVFMADSSVSVCCTRGGVELLTPSNPTSLLIIGEETSLCTAPWGGFANF